MHVEKVLSFNNGWSILTTEKSEQWQEALAALATLDDKFISKAIGSENRYPLDIRDLYISLYEKYQELLSIEYHWADNPLTAEDRITFYADVPAIKSGVLASLMGIDEITGGDFAAVIYLHTPYYFSRGAIEVAVYFIPFNATVDHFLELGAKPEEYANIPTEEVCREDMVKLKALTNAVPIVLAFISPTAPEEITVEEVTPVKVGGHTIERTIEFAPEFYQAGVGLLSYFGEVLRQKDPTTKAKVRIEQEGNRVRLHIESPSGDIEIIEKQLEQYALVVSRQAEPETLLANRAHIMQLETQLDITRIQVKQAQDLLQLADGQYTQRINNLEKQLEFLQTQFAVQIMQTGQVIDLATKQSDSHERVQTALLTHSGMLFKDLLQEASGNQRLLDAVSNLHQNLLSGLTAIEVEEQIKQALTTVKQEKPGLLARIYAQVEGVTLKAGTGASLGWATDVIKQFIHTN
jgi:hypothetical protein